MRIPLVARSRDVGFNMTPMIDMVFLLNIFFLLSNHVAQREAQMDLPLPVADSGEEQDLEAQRITLNVTADGGLLLAGRAIQQADLQQRLTQALAEQGPKLEVRIRADRHVPYRSVSPLLLACARAGVWKVTFGVYHSKDVR